MEKDPRRDLTRTVLAIVIIGVLIVASVWILRPFLAATIWSTMLVVSTWPILRALQKRLWNKRWLAATVMILALLLLFIIPLVAAIGTLVDNAGNIVDWASRLSEVKLPRPPDFVEKIPVIGEKTSKLWQEYADKGSEELAQIVKPYAGRVTSWFVSEVGGFGLVSLQFLLTVIIAAILYMHGESAASWVRRFGRRLAGERGDNVVRLAARRYAALRSGWWSLRWCSRCWLGLVWQSPAFPSRPC